MADLLAMLLTARIHDKDGEPIAEVLGVSIVGGRMGIIIDLELEIEEDDDPDGEEADIPEDDASKVVDKLFAVAK